MKLKLSFIALAFIALLLTNCTKDAPIKPAADMAATTHTSVNMLNGAIAPANSVITVAGHRYTKGETLLDGPAATARFKYPFGIQLMDDGSIFVADSGNNILRLISSTGDVSSVNIPDKSRENPFWYLKAPKYVAISQYGMAYVIDRVQEVPYNYPYHDEMKVFSPVSGGLISGYSSINYDARDVVIDPYDHNSVWTILGTIIYKIFTRKSDNFQTYSTLEFNNNYLPDKPGNYTFQALFPGYNGVIYFAYKGKLYKHSKDNTGAPIFPDLTFNNITCIVANKDCRTLYIADGGYIRRIDDGKLTTIAGPNKTYTDSRDGVGLGADVNAKYLALSKDENTLYFSDTRANAVRKFVLK